MEMIRLNPVFKDYLWGGVRLREQYNKNCPGDRVAESWELAIHKDGTTTVGSGAFFGLPLDEYLKKQKKGYLGKRGEAFSFFPVLNKLIDAKEALSIQVHPSDEYALAHHGEYGKTEVWYIMDAQPGAFLYLGLSRTVTRSEFRRRVAEGTVTEVLNKVEVKPGESYFIPSGTIHAIGAGILICEIQQNSNLTYRVYDFDRRDAGGNLRALHVEQALEVANLNRQDISPQGQKGRQEGNAMVTPIARCPYFSAVHYAAEGDYSLGGDRDSFTHILFLEGTGTIRRGETLMDYQKGDSFLVPAGGEIAAVTGAAQWMTTRV